MPKAAQIRELRGIIDPRLGRILIELADEQRALRQMVASLATLFDQMASIVEVQAGALSVVHRERATRLRAAGVEVATDPSVTGESAGER